MTDDNLDTFKPVGFDKQHLLALMKARGMDGIFLSSPENVFYTTGYPCLPSSGNPIVYALRNQLPFFSYIGSDALVALLCWGGAAMGVDYGADDVRMFFTYSMSLDELAGFITEKLQPGCSVGVESTCLHYAVELLHQHASPGKIAFIDDLLHQLRLVKSPAEIERIRQSTRIVDQTVLDLVKQLRIGMSRLELIQLAKAGMLKNGADGIDHVTVAFGGANPEVALGELLEKNQIVTLDLGAVYRGYVSDNRRLAYTGSIPAPLKELHAKLCQVVAELGKSLVPGKSFGDLHAMGLDLFAQAGLEPMFLHVGHSIGLQVDEHWLMADDPTPLEKGMVLNLELYSPSDEGVMVGDEETFVVTGEAPEKLSTLPVEIISV
jgi:Xaa-Pro aminopeptidase